MANKLLSQLPAKNKMKRNFKKSLITEIQRTYPLKLMMNISWLYIR